VQVDEADGQALADALGIDVIPTVQFWRKGAKLWEHKVGLLPALLRVCLESPHPPSLACGCAAWMFQAHHTVCLAVTARHQSTSIDEYV
jgi:hypothetical protein